MVISKIFDFFQSSSFRKSKYEDSNISDIKHDQYIAGSKEISDIVMQLLDIVAPSSNAEILDLIRFAVNNPEEYSENVNDYFLMDFVDAPNFIWLVTLSVLSDQGYINEVDWKQEVIDIFDFLDGDLKTHLSDNEYERIKALADDTELMPDKFFEIIKSSLVSTKLDLIFFVKNSDSYVFAATNEDNLEPLSQIVVQFKKLLQVESKHDIDITIDIP